MTPIIAVLIAGLLAGASASAQTRSNKVWISVGDAAYAE
jgi:leucyl aminopeptidase